MSDQSNPPPRVDWRAADMRNVDLSGMNLEGADLRAADLSGANFTGSFLRNADFRGANVSGANFQNANLYGARMQGVEAFQADFRGAEVRLANFGGAYLDGAAMSPVELGKPRLPTPGEVAAYRGDIRDTMGQVAEIDQESLTERIKRSREQADQGGDATTDDYERLRVRSLPAEQKEDKSRGR